MLGTIGLGAFLASMTAAVRLQSEHPASVGRCAAVGSRRVPRLPRGMTAADERTAAARRVSVVASIGYCAFLGGPPLIGYLGRNITVGRALSRLPSYSGWRLWSPDPCGPFLTKSGETRE